MITAKDIEKYKDKSLPALVKLADKYFNRFIRLRDAEKGCVSCDTGKVEHASHLYSAGNYKALRYNENNVNGSCEKCNTHLRGNLLEYRTRLVIRIGEAEVDKLEYLAAQNKRNGFPVERLSIIETIITYRNKLKNK